MAFLGSIGKFFTQSPIGLPMLIVSAPMLAAKTIVEGPKATIAPVVQAGTGLVRSAVAGVVTGARNPAIDNPIPRQSAPQIYQPVYGPVEPYQYVPMQYGGSFDPNLGGGVPSWDFSTSWASVAEPTPYQTRPPTYSEAGIWD